MRIESNRKRSGERGNSAFVLSSPAFSISVRRWRFGGERFHLDLPETFLHLQGRLEKGTKMLRNQARGQSKRQLSKIYSIPAQ